MSRKQDSMEKLFLSNEKTRSYLIASWNNILKKLHSLTYLFPPQLQRGSSTSSMSKEHKVS
jgi:hypothetical protein